MDFVCHQIKPQFQEILRLSEENVGECTLDTRTHAGMIVCCQLSQLFVENVSGRSSDTNTVEVNKLFAGCRRRFAHFCPMFLLLKRCLLLASCQMFGLGGRWKSIYRVA